MKKIRVEAMARLGLLTLLLLAWGLLRSAQAEGPLILSLGEDSYLPKTVIEASTGAKFIDGLGSKKLGEIQLVILSNIDCTSLPDPLRDGLVDYLQNGGALLITGGARSFGSGGYGNSNLAGILPFQIMVPRDWQPSRSGNIVPTDKSHPVFSGVDFLKTPLINQFNNLGWQPGARGIAMFAKFGQQPLIAERNVGAGIIFGIAFNMAETGSIWPQGNRFCLNLIGYLLQKSAIPAR
jgi:uncharacterized membrane protein